MSDQSNFYRAKLRYETDAWDLYEALSAEKSIVVIDARSPDAYAQEHIPGAINLPHRQMNSDSTAHLQHDRTYVVYCDGIGCNASTKGALKMTELGFAVMELLGGLEWWRRDGYATEGANGQPGKRIDCGC